MAGKIVNIETGNTASIEEYWEHSGGADTSPEGLQMLGFALPYLFLEDLEPPRLRMGLRTEIGNIEISEELTLPSTHLVTSNYWIPFNPDVMQKLTECLEVRSLEIGQQVSVFDYLYLLTASNNSKIEFRFAEEVSNKFANLATDSSIGENLIYRPYDYQLTGMRWLGSLHSEKIGGLLCDEMGLGKTLQAIGLVEKIQHDPQISILICVPNSLIINWEREFKKFAPQVKIHTYAGPDRFLQPKDFDELRVVLTTYDMLVRDFAIIEKKKWDVLICDEAQFLKNPDSQRSQAVLRIEANAKYLLTGTPVENSLKDLWTLGNIIYPGILGSRKAFWNLVDDNPIDAYRVGKGLSPLIKRRLVKDVLTDLPSISTINHIIPPTRDFAIAYENIRLRRAEITSGADPRTIFLRLRQFCCHPELVGAGGEVLDIPKFFRLKEILEEILISNEKVIIFSSFLQSMEILIKYSQVWFPGVWTASIDGKNTPAVQQRMEIIDDFSEQEGFAILVINPEAGGVGLNITAANHVVHFNLLWNPSKEAQATARVYRPGQDADHVFVHRLLYANTVEEHMNNVLDFKRELADSSMTHPENKADLEFIEDALSLSPLSAILSSSQGGSNGVIY